MAIAIRASGTATGDGTAPGLSVTVTKPAAAVGGDLCILVFSIAQGNGTATISTPTGWTAIASNVGTAATDINRTSVFYRFIQAGDTSWNVGLSLSDAYGWVLQTFIGVDAGTPVDSTGTTSTNTASATITANAVTVVKSGALHLIGLGAWIGGAASATSFTALNNATPATNEQCALLYNTTPKSAGSTGTVSCTIGAASGNSISCVPFALRPASPPIGPFPSLPPGILAS